ncbi:MAG: hypothetical protein E7167_03705 [Firmicutes bacterium]|nr:hypothetical protein [Bacillota bacterium]
MYNYGYDFYEPTVSTGLNGMAVWTAVALVLAIIGGILAYFLFVKSNKKIDNKFLKWLKEFLNFKKMLIETILKVSYIVLAIFITLFSFNFIGNDFLTFLLTLTIGNIVLRLIYEASLMMLMIWKNTTEINHKMK